MPGYANTIKSCYIGPKISPEEFVAEHFFLYLIKGIMHGYDGNKHYTLLPGEYCIVRKNHLARYKKEKQDNEFEKVVVTLDEVFLKKFHQRHPIVPGSTPLKSAFFLLKKSGLVPHFIDSLMPYYNKSKKIDPTFADVKREELLLILLQTNPALGDILFDFGIPEKIDLEAFMNNNYKFNVSIERFAWLTGRSLSAFKRDFEKIFNDTPSRWLVQRRLQESYFLIDKKNKRPSDIYLDLGFEDLSHFSFAFKKLFGLSPSQLSEGKKKAKS
ncbi:MAG TPA: AraC family transcriptional regulator [Puia sp.]|jgi:AraC-like DNA-binding protein